MTTEEKQAISGHLEDLNKKIEEYNTGIPSLTNDKNAFIQATLLQSAYKYSHTFLTTLINQNGN